VLNGPRILERGSAGDAIEVASSATVGGVAVAANGAISDAEGTSISPRQIPHTNGLPEWLTSADCAVRQRRQRK
jgi:hypothetical protein